MSHPLPCPNNEEPAERRVLIQRRTARRMLVDYPATLQTVCGNLEGQLANLSIRGAKLTLSEPIEIGTNARLRIEAHEVFCRVVWSEGNKCGLVFEHDLEAQALDHVLAHSTEQIVPIACAEIIPMGKKRGGKLVFDSGS